MAAVDDDAGGLWIRCVFDRSNDSATADDSTCGNHLRSSDNDCCRDINDCSINDACRHNHDYVGAGSCSGSASMDDVDAGSGASR